MVVAVPDEAIAAMEQSAQSEVIVTAFYGDTQTIPSDAFPDFESVPITGDGSLTWDADGQIQCNGQVSLAAMGQILVPNAKTDPLAPFGQELQIVRRVHYADASWDIPGGRLRIQDVPQAQAFYEVMGWAAQLNVCDRFDLIQADDFIGTQTPSQLVSTWDEIAAMSPVPVVRSLPDAPIPASLAFTQGRLDAITQLIANLGGEPAMTRQGALTARPANNYLTAESTVAVVNGTVSVAGGMSNDLINSVTVTNPNDATILGVAEITDLSDPLCVTGPLGRRTKTFSDPLMTTTVMAAKAAQTYLAKLSTVQARTVKVSCLPRWDLELGDFIQVTDQLSDDVWLGEVRGMSWPWDVTALQSLTLTVADKR